MKKTLTIIIALTFSVLASAQQTDTLDMDPEKTAVINVVEQFLTAAGNYDLDAIPLLFSEKANIYGASLRDGEWNTYTMTIQEFIERLNSRTNPTKYTEPVSKFTVHMDKGMLAFVKADAVFTINGEPRNYNFDYFTLGKENGNWKILNGSYVSVRIKE